MADRFCGNCGNELRPDDKFCPNCGRPVYETAVVPTPEADVELPPPVPVASVDVGLSAPEEASEEASSRPSSPVAVVVAFLGVGGVIASVLILFVFLVTLFSGDVQGAFSWLLVSGAILVLIIGIVRNRGRVLPNLTLSRRTYTSA